MEYNNKLIAKNIYKLRDEFHTLTLRPADLWTWKHVEHYLDILADYFKNIPDPEPVDLGVTRIIAGTNITISPANGKGDVTINALGAGSQTTSNVLIDGGTFTAPNNALIDAGGFI
jgi:hypothetical protein